MGFPCSSIGKESACNSGDPGSILGQEDPLEKEMATHSSILPWRIPWTEEPGGLQSMGLQKSQTRLSDLTITTAMHRYGGFSHWPDAFIFMSFSPHPGEAGKQLPPPRLTTGPKDTWLNPRRLGPHTLLALGASLSLLVQQYLNPSLPSWPPVQRTDSP